jgi:GT2 family glycosyltransferase
MTGLSVVIPSRTISNFLPCAEAVRKHEPSARIILVDDGIEPGSCWKDEGPKLVVKGIKDFIFARNVNLGIKAAGNDDVVILNDDAILKTPGGLSLLQRVAEEHPEFGIIASTTNNTGNVNQLPKGIGLREDPRMVTFICVLLPRRTIESVGLMDEEFGGFTSDGRVIYGFCDDSYCLRVRRTGLKIGIHDGAFVDHATLPSTFRGNPRAPADLDAGREIFIKKWGSHPL